MKIAIDSRGVSWYKGTGIGTYTDNLLKAMLENNKEDYFHIFWSEDSCQDYKVNCKMIITSKKYHNFFEKEYFPAYIKENDIEIFHVPQNGIGLSQNISCKKIVTIHDLIPYLMPETVGKSYQLKFLKEMPYIISYSDAIITVSKESKKDILRFFPIDEKKIHVIPLAADSKYKVLNKDKCRKILKAKFNINKPFILYVGGFSPRKNLKSLIISFKKSMEQLNKEYDLVLVGAQGDECEKIKLLSNELSISNNVIFTGFIEELYLPIFYNGCDLFTYPSSYEGFGLPPLEAMCCGAPVICSNSSSIPEVVGTGGILINTNEVEGLTKNIIMVLNNLELQNKLKEKAMQQSKNFSWKITAEKTLEVYKSINKPLSYS